MKELSIEEKAKRYDEAIEIAKEINNEQRAQPFNVMTKVFPELAESEDEKIRKELISLVKETKVTDRYYELNKMLAWLEKQGEQNTAWSEEDDSMVEDVRNSFEFHCDEMTEALQEQYNKFFDKVKSLRPHNRWKPSDEQMDELRKYSDNVVLRNLYYSLKKLK